MLGLHLTYSTMIERPRAPLGSTVTSDETSRLFTTKMGDRNQPIDSAFATVEASQRSHRYPKLR